MADLTVSLLIKLIDQVSAPARHLRDNLRGTIGGLRTGFAQAIREGFSAANVDAAIARGERNIDRARGRLLGAFGTGLTLLAPVLNMGQFESQLVGFGNTAGIFGDDLKKIESELRATAPLVNKSAGELLTGLEYLVGKGLSPEQGLAAIKSVGMTATATGASIEHMSASGFAALDNLKIPADQLQLAFDAMAQSGKSGGFELSGMAQYFATVTAAAQTLKMEGVGAVAELGAALQIARKGTGDDSTAANNLKNFLTKLNSPDVRKNFEQLGITIDEEFAKAEKAGVSRFEHMIGVINELTASGTIKTSDLFGDQQALDFLAVLLPNLEDYARIRDQALAAEGINQGDFGRVMQTFTEKIKAAAIEIDTLMSNSSVLLGVAKELVDQFTAGVRAVNAFAEANPELTRTLVLAAAGLMAASIAAKLASFALWSTITPVRQLAGFFLKFEGAKNIATGWRILAGSGRLLGGAFRLVAWAAGAVVTGLGAITAPVWAVIAVLIAAAFTLWKYWDRISSFVSGMAEALGGLLSEALGAVGTAIDGLVTKIGELLGFDQGQIDAFRTGISEGFTAAFGAIGGIIDGAKEVLGGFWTWLTGFFSQEKLSDAEKGEMKAAGAKLITDMWTGIKEKFAEVVEWFKTLPAQIVAAIGEIDLSGVIKMPDIGAWWTTVTGGGQTPDTPPAPPPEQGNRLENPPPGWRRQGNMLVREGYVWWNPASWGQTPAAAPDTAALAPPTMSPLHGAALPADIQQTINAEVIDKRPPSVTLNVTQNITGVSDPEAAGNAAARALTDEMNRTSQGALSDGGP